MSAFKDAVAADVISTFINLDEFADLHEIAGTVDVPCILDKIITQSNGSDALMGVFVNQLTIYVKVGDIETPVEGQILSVDGSMHLVRSVSLEDGILVVVAEANEQ